jgi:hypothetical protein
MNTGRKQRIANATKGQTMTQKKIDELKTGAFPGVPNHEYHYGEEYRKYLSKSCLSYLMKSPAHYKANRSEEKYSSPEMDFGSAAHDIIIRGDESNIKVGPSVGKSSKGWKEFKLSLEPGQIPIQDEDIKIIKEMAEVFQKHKYAKPLISGEIESEITYLWKSRMFENVHLKCRPDILRRNEKIICDYKTTKSAWQNDFSRAAINYGYDMQAAHYIEGVQEIEGVDGYDFYFIAQEKDPPYAIKVYSAGKELIALGNVKRNIALTNYWNAYESGNFDKSYDEVVDPLNPPKWAMMEFNVEI